jgi:hypothetical protein
MAVEVHVSGKPAKPRRALLGSACLLLIACILAGAMTWTRAGQRLGALLEPPGWSISFRPPLRYIGEAGPTLFGPAYQFHGRVGAGAVATLVVYRVDVAPGENARQLCDQIIQAYFGEQPPPGILTQTRSDVRIGTRDAVEVWDPVLDTLVRAIVLAPGDAYALTLSVHGARIEPDLYALFDQTCTSVEFRLP